MNIKFPSRLEWLSCSTGFTLMVFELVAARVLAPSIGSSMYVWTSVIGVIIAALSVGYYVGGYMADKRSRASDVLWLLIITAILIALSAVFYPQLLPLLSLTQMDVRLQAVVATLVLFAPASLVLGMMSPYLAKLQVTSLKTSGSAVAGLSAWNSIGGIAGTFLTGFFLFGWIGSRDIFGVLVVLLLLSTLLLQQKWQLKHWVAAGSVLLLSTFVVADTSAITIDTASAQYKVVEWHDDKATYRGLVTGPKGMQSAIMLEDSNEPIFWYTKEMTALIAATEQRQNILVLGGGTFTLPQQLARTYPDSQIDVVEIDPGLADIAREHFFYEDEPNVELLFDDARHFVNTTKRQYDIIVVDVYGDSDIPFTLVTKEYGESLQRLVRPQGVVMANFIAGTKGACRDMLAMFEAPYRQQFSERAMKLSADDGLPGVFNIVAMYANEPVTHKGYTAVEVPHVAPYQDDFVPAERLRSACR